jgi:uncharacterized cupredoxin-like copper-binding protein
MTTSPLRRRALGLAVCAALGLSVAACGGDDSSRDTTAARPVSTEVPDRAPRPPRTVTFEASDFAFSGPASVEAGVVALQLDNRGAEAHQLGLFKLNDGVDAGTVLGALGAAGNLEAGRAYGTWIAGPNGVAAGGQQSVVTELLPGQYVVACLMPGADGVPHAMKGMLTNLTVTPTTAPARAIGDSALPTIGLKNYFFELPKDFDGHGSVLVENRGDQVHELVIVKLNAGKTVDDVVAYEKTPAPRGAAPFVDAGGVTFVDPGQRARMDLDLAPGNYAVVCYLPTPGDATPHLMLGMVHGFTVDA